MIELDAPALLTGAHIDTEYDFSKAKTFAFALVPQKPLTSEHGKMVRTAIENALTGRGFEMTTQGTADLWISYDLGVLSPQKVAGGALCSGLSSRSAQLKWPCSSKRTSSA